MKRKTIDRQFFDTKKLPKKRNNNMLNFMLVFLKTKQILSFFLQFKQLFKTKDNKIIYSLTILY